MVDMKIFATMLIAGIISVIACYGYHCITGDASLMAFTGIGAIVGFITCIIAY